MRAFEEGQKYPYKYIVKNSPSDRYLTYGIYSYIGDDKAKELIDLLYNKTSTTIVLFKSLNRKSYYYSYMVKIKYRDRNHAEKIHGVINNDSNLHELEYTQHSSLDLDGSFKFLCVHTWGDVKMKPETQKHFGDIFEDGFITFKDYVTEASSPPKAEWVIILKFTKVGSEYVEDTDSEVTYTMKKTKDLTPEEIKKLKTLKPFTGFTRYKKAFSRTEDDGKPMIAFFDTKKKVEWILWYYKHTGTVMTPSVPIKPKTREHFGDLID